MKQCKDHDIKEWHWKCYICIKCQKEFTADEKYIEDTKHWSRLDF